MWLVVFRRKHKKIALTLKSELYNRDLVNYPLKHFLLLKF